MTESTDLTTGEEAPREESPAEKQRKRMDALVAAVEGRSAQLTTLLAESGITFKLFVEVFRRAMIKGADNPATNLLAADAGSVIQACIDSCTAGVLPDGKRGAIVLYNTNVAPRGQPKRYVKKAQFLVMYEGMLQIAYGSGNFRSIMAQVVYDVDEWDYEMGIDPWIKHKPGLRPPRPEGPPYAVVAAYAVAKTTNGGVFVEVFEQEDIRKVMAVSRATSGPAVAWFEQMARKGPLRRLWKFLPRDARMERVLEVDEPNYDLDALDPPAPPERKLQAGFAPKQEAISHQPAEAMPMDMVGDDDREMAPLEGEQEAVIISGASNDGEKRDTTPEEAQSAPAVQFAEALEKARDWLGVKQALKSLAKSPAWEMPEFQVHALRLAWDRRTELADKTDFISDLWLWESWLVGTEPDPDAIEGNWRIVALSADYAKAGDDTRARIQDRVEWAKEQQP